MTAMQNDGVLPRLSRWRGSCIISCQSRLAILSAALALSASFTG